MLSARELAILKHVADGLTSKEIARKLNLHYRTVQTYFVSIRQKLNAKNITHAIYLARRELEKLY